MTTGRICLVVSELLGHRRAGGIATATSYLAELLAGAGHEVTVLDTAAPDDVVSPEWQRRYQRAGIVLERLSRHDHVSRPFVADSYRVYQQLKRRPFSMIVFQDWNGLGFASMAAKRTGLAFGDTRLVHIVHGPTEWLWEANQVADVQTDGFAIAHIERRAAEWADTIVGPSRYLVDWMAAKGWDLPADRRNIAYPTPALLGHIDRPDLSGWRPEPLTELVFFGRFEERKGIRVFVEALNRVGAERLEGLRVSFLGRPTPYSVSDVAALFDPAIAAAVGGPRFVIDKDSLAARAYLAEPGRLAVIPSLVDNSPNVVMECVEGAVPFIASSTGGIPELVAAVDHERTLFDPTPPALAAHLRRILDSAKTPMPPAPGWDYDEILPAWERLLEPAPKPSVSVTEPALVSAVVPHHAQPRLVRHVVRSLADQDHPDLEIVVVDDGTPDPGAIDALRDLIAEPWGRDVRLVTQENRYLGAARNAGVRAARGDHLVFVDDDDVVEPQYVSTLLRAVTTAGADAASCAIVACEDDDGTLDDSEQSIWVFLGDAPQLAPVWNVVGGAACMVRRDAWEAVGGFHERHGVGHEDWAFLVEIVLAGRSLVAVPEPLYRYRVRSDSMLRSTSRYRNMQPVFDAFAARLPDGLAQLPAQLYGAQLVLDEIGEQLGGIALGQGQSVASAALAQRDAMYASTTWKVGSLVLAPARAALAARRRLARG